MYYFLAIVLEKDIAANRIEPEYILCTVNRESDTRGKWMVARNGSSFSSQPKVLVASLTGHDDMIEFFRYYRTRNHSHGDKRYAKASTRKFVPKGSLFWFGCDVYGKPNGFKVYIRNVPFMDGKTRETRDMGYRNLLESKNKIHYLNEIFTMDNGMTDLKSTNIKPTLAQKLQPIERKNYGRSKEECLRNFKQHQCE